MYGDEGLFAVAGNIFEADLFGVHGLVGLEVVEEAARDPSDGAKGWKIRARFHRSGR
jgi:hypothetical protein